MSDLGSATPSKSHQWGAQPIGADGCVAVAGIRWFPERASAVAYARNKFGRRYAIARAWGDDAGERYDPEAAAQHSRTHARRNGVLPTHLRCDYVKGDDETLQRCTQGADHTGPHEY